MDKILLDSPVKITTTSVGGFIIEDPDSGSTTPKGDSSIPKGDSSILVDIPIDNPIISKEDNNANENKNVPIIPISETKATKTHFSSYISSPEDSPRIDDKIVSKEPIIRTKSPVNPQTSSLSLKKVNEFIIDDPVSSSDSTPRDDKPPTQSKATINRTKSPVNPQTSTSSSSKKAFVIDDPVSSNENIPRDDKRSSKVSRSKSKSPKSTPTKKIIENNNIPTETLSSINNSMKSLSIANDNIKISKPILKRKTNYTKTKIMSFRPTLCPSKSGKRKK
jgi:hypothetical protein